MSKERELLKRWLIDFGKIHPDIKVLKETKELLAQPEQEPVGYLYKQKDCYGEWATIFKVDKPYITWHDIKDIIPVYLAPPKREPLSEATINYYLERLGSSFKWDDGFKAGVNWAEKARGIGGGE